jgi:DNA-binding IclR family transcriptional regulator
MKPVVDMEHKPALYKTVSHVADILLCLVNGVNTITEIADFCKLSKSTVSRLLKSLSESEFVLKDQFNHRYYLGRLMAKFSSSPYVLHKYLVVCSLREMLRLRDISGETVVLSILVGIQYMNLHQVTSEHELRITADGVTRGPLLLGASAKVLLSQVSNEDLELALKYSEFDRKDGSSIIDKNAFVEKMIQIKQQGYVVTCGESIPGVLGISAPIKNYLCPAALSILGPEDRLRPKMDPLIEEVKISASRISDFVMQMPGGKISRSELDSE